MLPEMSDMLEHINATINQCFEEKYPDKSLHPKYDNHTMKKLGREGKNYLLNVKKSVSLRRMEQRIRALEEQNHHLLYFIYFLFEKSFDLERSQELKELQNGKFQKNKLNVRSKGIDANNSLGRPDCPLQKIVPCPTRREMEVLTLLNKGLCAKEIAHLLFISETTVITHKKNLKEKFHAKNTVELISKAYDVLAKPEK